MSSKSTLRLDWCSYAAAKYAVEHWHYSRRMPRSKLAKLGVWEDEQFIGVVIFGMGASDSLGVRYGLTETQCCELVRIALTQHRTPVSRIVSIALSILHREYHGLRAVVSFADTAQNHHGGIYQGSNWFYLGRTAQSDEWLIQGKHYHGRGFRKLLEGTRWTSLRGMTTAQKAVALDPNATRLKGSVKHRYLYPLDDEMRLQIAPLAKPYPKRPRAESIEGDAPTFHVGEDGPLPISALQETAAA